MTQALPAPTIDPSDATAAAVRFASAAPADVRYAVLETPAGRVVAAATSRGLVRLAYEDWNDGVDRIVETLASSLSPRILEQAAALRCSEEASRQAQRDGLKTLRHTIEDDG